MRNVVVVLAAIVASGCASNDDADANGPEPSSPTTGDPEQTGTDGGETDGTADGTAGAEESSGGFSVTTGAEESSGSSGEQPDGIDESFEDVLVGEQPGMPWRDVVDRIDAPTIPSPTAMVIDTVDSDGAPTQALHLHDAIGTSQGLIAGIEPSARHRLEVNVRVEQWSDATGGTTWPIAVGFSHDGPAADINDDPHAVVRVEADGSWHLIVDNGEGGAEGFDEALPFPAAEIDRWYRVTIEVDADQGTFHARLTDPGTSRVVGDHVLLLPPWFELMADYDAITLHDGEYGTTAGTQGGLASVDDVEYAATFGG
ncbi:MAG: hypothetical protein K0V04_21290 [Deltaproteobacteria bacterium]|nr:hypothetical protein [Deltaproteobacteria bacterium]